MTTMKKPAPYTPIDPSELSITSEPYPGRERINEGKYAETFRKVKRGERIVCPAGRAGSIANAYSEWIKKNLGVKNPVVRTKQRCEDGKAGVWWVGEKPASKPETVWAGLKKAA